MKDLKTYLKEKGWSNKDIKKTVKIIQNAKENKNPKIKVLDKLVYWISLIFILIGNFIITIALIPELIALKGPLLYIVIATLGISFGLLFELLIRTIENLNIKHHLFLGITIPILGIINFIILSNNMEKLVGISSNTNPIIIGALYTITFMLPYLIYQGFLAHK